MFLTKTTLLETLEVLRQGNNTALDNEELESSIYEQEETIRNTFDLVEAMITKLDDNTSCGHVSANRIVNDIQRSYNPESKAIAIIWCEEDVRGMNKDKNSLSELDDGFTGTPLTDEEVDDVLSRLERNHDCNNGITWDTIDAYVDDIER